jgi:hypothetical protein
MFEKLIVAYMVEKISSKCGTLRAVLLKTHVFCDMVLSLGEYLFDFSKDYGVFVLRVRTSCGTA